MVVTSKLNFEKGLKTMYLIKIIIQLRNRKSILDDDAVYGPTVNTHIQIPSFLGSNRVGTEQGLKLSNIPTI